MSLDRKFLLCAFGFAIFGMGLGILMAESMNHKLLVAHAHILLVGFVVSFIYGLIHKLWVDAAGKTVASIQFYLHLAAALVMSVGLILLYGGIVPEPTIGPVLGMSSIGVLLGALLMVFMILKSPRANT